MIHQCPECGADCTCNEGMAESEEVVLECIHCPELCGSRCDCSIKEGTDFDPEFREYDPLEDIEGRFKWLEEDKR